MDATPTQTPADRWNEPGVQMVHAILCTTPLTEGNITAVACKIVDALRTALEAAGAAQPVAPSEAKIKPLGRAPRDIWEVGGERAALYAAIYALKPKRDYKHQHLHAAFSAGYERAVEDAAALVIPSVPQEPVAPSPVLSVNRDEWRALSPEAQAKLEKLTGALHPDTMLARARAAEAVRDIPLGAAPSHEPVALSDERVRQIITETIGFSFEAGELQTVNEEDLMRLVRSIRAPLARALYATPPEGATQDAGEPAAIGTLTISKFRGHLENTEFDYYGSLPLGSHQVYAAPPRATQDSPQEALDARRLDWLEANGIAIERDIEGEWRTLQYRRYGNPIRGPERMSLRDAIDAALSQGTAGRAGTPTEGSAPKRRTMRAPTREWLEAHLDDEPENPTAGSVE